MKHSISHVKHYTDCGQTRKRLVLAVDDDDGFLDELGETLAGNGYDLVAVGDGRQTVALARTIRPDVILLDLKLDDSDGFQLACLLKSDPATAGIPVIAMTGHPGYVGSRREVAEFSQKCGFVDCLTKPFSPFVLMARIDGCCGGQTTADPINGR